MNKYEELVNQLKGVESHSKGELLKQAAAAIEELARELEDERYRHDRYVDYTLERDKQIDGVRALVRGELKC